MMVALALAARVAADGVAQDLTEPGTFGVEISRGMFVSFQPSIAVLNGSDEQLRAASD